MENKYILAIKFFTESKNEEQMEIAYGEIESFLETFENFLFYYLLDPKNISENYLSSLSDEVK